MTIDISEFIKVLQNQDNYVWIIIGIALFLVALIFTKLETVYSLTDKLAARRLLRLQNFIESKSVSEQTKDVLREQVESIAFRHSTGILAEKYLRIEIIRLHKQANGRLTYRDFRRAFRFLSVGNSGKLAVREIRVLDWVAQILNYFVFAIICFCSLVAVLFSIFGSVLETLTLLQETILFIFSMFLFVLSLVPLSQTFSVGAANKIKQENTTASNRGDEQLPESSLSSRNNQLRPFGLCKGEFVVPDDFDDPLPEEILKMFEGE